MTRPTLICMVPKNGTDREKIFIRTLLFSTGAKGQYIQNMFIRLSQSGRKTGTFNIWAYGDKELVRGSGLFVDKTGVAKYHHFLLPENEPDFKFTPGEYLIEIFLETIGGQIKKIFSQRLLTPTYEPLNQSAIFFDWEPDKKEYYPHLDAGGGLPKLS